MYCVTNQNDNWPLKGQMNAAGQTKDQAAKRIQACQGNTRKLVYEDGRPAKNDN